MSKNYTRSSLEREAREETQSIPSPKTSPKTKNSFYFYLKEQSFKITGLELCMISTAVSNMFPVTPRKIKKLLLPQQISTILTTFGFKNPTFGHFYSTRNILTAFCCKSPTIGHSYKTRNILTRFCSKSPTFGHYSKLEIF